MACGILVPQPGIEPISPALEGKFLTTGPPGKSLTTSLLNLQFLPHRLVFPLVYTCSLISPALKYMKAPPGSTLLLVSTLLLSFHQRQISWNMSLFLILPSILFSSSLSWQLLRHCSRAVSCGQISWSFLWYLCTWSQHHWAVPCFLRPIPSLGLGDMRLLGFPSVSGTTTFLASLFILYL